MCFAPRYGWGWSHRDSAGNDTPADYAEIDEAGEFHIRVRRFFAFQGELRGVVGQVEQSGHLFDGLWAVTWTMIVGEFDLTDRLCTRWDIELGLNEPSRDDWPVSAAPVYCGFGGVLAASLGAIARYSSGLG